MSDERTLTVTYDEGNLILNAVMLEEARLRALEPVPDDAMFADYYRGEREKLIASAVSIRAKLCTDD